MADTAGLDMDRLTDRSGDALYERDFYTWTQEQAGLPRRRAFDKADVAHIIEEIETLGRSELSALRSSYKLIAVHLLKMLIQPGKATASSEITVIRERGSAEDILADNPGLKPKRHEIFQKAYASARRDAARETKLDMRMFPVEPPCGLDELESSTSWPEGFPR